MAKPASTRRAAREAALQTLYSLEVGKQGFDEVFTELIEHVDLDEKTIEFARRLVLATQNNLAQIDPVLERLATGFPIARQTVVDRNILRLAAAEVLFAASDAPPGAIVNEAVELAKKYSTAESGRFVNGVLGALVRETESVRESGEDSDRSE